MVKDTTDHQASTVSAPGTAVRPVLGVPGTNVPSDHVKSTDLLFPRFPLWGRLCILLSRFPDFAGKVL